MKFRKNKTNIKDYFKLSPDIVQKCDWIFIFGKRSNGKSYAIKHMVINHAIQEIRNGSNNGKFFYVRRYQDDVNANNVYRYLKDIVYNQKTDSSPLVEMSGGRFNDFKVARKTIYVLHVDNDGKETDIVPIGYYINVGDAERIKSNDYTDVDNIVFEEVIANTKPYLPDEPAKFGSLISTVARNEKLKVFMIGNNDNRDCVYFRYYGLDRVKKQKPGDIDIYEKTVYNEGDEYTVSFAVIFADGNVQGSRMFFGHDNDINNTGAWRSETQPKMTQKELEKYDKIYEMIIERHDLRYKCEFYIDPVQNGRFWYIRPKTRPIKRNDRVISDIISPNPRYTSGIIPLNRGEYAAFEYLKNGKIFFSDDLTGTEAKRAIIHFLNAPLSGEYK